MVIEQDIYSTPAILRQTLARVDERGDMLAPWLQGPAVFLGCGSSYCIALAAAALYEDARGVPAQGIMASEYRPRPGWTHVAISRTGKTTELVEAMRRARGAGARVALVGGEPGAPAQEQADAVLPLEFAPEQGVIQTRFISAATLALRLLIGGERARAALRDLPDRIERALGALDTAPLVSRDHVVFLGRGWRHGLALMAALNLQETALVVPEGHQTLEYRHGPIASADEGTLVWCFDPPDDAASAAVLDDVQRTGATVRCTDDDPLVAAAQAQLLAVRMAEARGVDPNRPRHLSRAIVLPGSQ
jgi:glutamine---fructose-6-phosphate transaminase (isomerizing)